MSLASAIKRETYIKKSRKKTLVTERKTYEKKENQRRSKFEIKRTRQNVYACRSPLNSISHF